MYRRDFGQPNVGTFDEAADTTVFDPREAEKTDDVIWIGNWGDEERTREIREYLVDSAHLLPELRFAVHGVRYPEPGLRAMREARIDFRGWIASYRVPETFAREDDHAHPPRSVPRPPPRHPHHLAPRGDGRRHPPPLHSTGRHRRAVPRRGRDHLMVHSPTEMREQMLRPSRDDARARLAESGPETILARRTRDHRTEQLETIVAGAGVAGH